MSNVDAIHDDLVAIRDFRNNIHLFAAASSAEANYMEVSKNEQTMLDKARNAVAELMKMSSQ